MLWYHRRMMRTLQACMARSDKRVRASVEKSMLFKPSIDSWNWNMKLAYFRWQGKRIMFDFFEWTERGPRIIFRVFKTGIHYSMGDRLQGPTPWSLSVFTLCVLQKRWKSPDSTSFSRICPLMLCGLLERSMPFLNKGQTVVMSQSCIYLLAPI